jgi:hypothetical protein
MNKFPSPRMRVTEQKAATDLQSKDCRQFHGLAILFALTPGAYAPGYMLAPAPQAKTDFSGKARSSKLPAAT